MMHVSDVASLLWSCLYWLVAFLVTVAVAVTIVGGVQYTRNKRANRELLLRQRNAQQQIAPNAGGTTAANATGNSSTNASAPTAGALVPVGGSAMPVDRHHVYDARGERARRHTHVAHTQQQQQQQPVHPAHDDDYDEGGTTREEDRDDPFDWARVQRRRGGSHDRERLAHLASQAGIAPPINAAANTSTTNASASMHARGRSSIYDAVKKASMRGVAGGNKRHSLDAAAEGVSIPSTPAITPRHPIRGRERANAAVRDATNTNATTNQQQQQQASQSLQDAGPLSPITPSLDGDGVGVSACDATDLLNADDDVDPREADLDSPTPASESGASHASSERGRRIRRTRNGVVDGGGVGGSESATAFPWVVRTTSSSSGGGHSRASATSGSSDAAITSSPSTDPTPLHAAATPMPRAHPQQQLSQAVRDLLAMCPELEAAQFGPDGSETPRPPTRSLPVPTSPALIYAHLLSLVTHAHTHRVVRFASGSLIGMIDVEARADKISSVQAEVLRAIIDQYRREEETDATPHASSATATAHGTPARVVHPTLQIQTQSQVQHEAPIATLPVAHESSAAPPSTAGASLAPHAANGTEDSVHVMPATSIAPTELVHTNGTASDSHPLLPSSGNGTGSTIPISVAPILAVPIAPSVPAELPPLPPPTPLVLPPIPSGELSAQQVVAINLGYLAESHAQRTQLAQQACVRLSHDTAALSAAATISPASPSSTSVSAPISGAHTAEGVSAALVYSEMYHLLQRVHETLADRLQARVQSKLPAATNHNEHEEKTRHRDADTDVDASINGTRVRTDRAHADGNGNGNGTNSVVADGTPLRRYSSASATPHAVSPRRPHASSDAAHALLRVRHAMPSYGSSSGGSGSAASSSRPHLSTASSSGSTSGATSPPVRTLSPASANGDVGVGDAIEVSSRPTLLRPASFPVRAQSALTVPASHEQQYLSDPVSPALHPRAINQNAAVSSSEFGTATPLRVTQASQPHGILFTPSPGSAAAAAQQLSQQQHSSYGTHLSPLHPSHVRKLVPPSHPASSVSRETSGGGGGGGVSSVHFSSSVAGSPQLLGANRLSRTSNSNSASTSQLPSGQVSPGARPPPLLAHAASAGVITIPRSFVTVDSSLPTSSSGGVSHHHRSPSYSSFPSKRRDPARSASFSEETSIMAMMKSLGREHDRSDTRAAAAATSAAYEHAYNMPHAHPHVKDRASSDADAVYRRARTRHELNANGYGTPTH